MSADAGHYKNILNYTFAALERNTATIFSKYARTPVALRNETRLVRSITGVLEFAFFSYAADPRVNISVRLARLISLIVDELHSLHLSNDIKHQIFKYIFDNLSRQLRKSSKDHSPNIEVMYLVLALRKLGRDYLISEEIMATYFGIIWDKENGTFMTNRYVDYFASTVCLSYITAKKKYAKLREAIEASILERFQDRAAYVDQDSELLMMYLDVTTCPFVSTSTKTKIAEFFGHSNLQLQSLKAAAPFWFTDWKGFDLSISLDKKRTREVY